MRKRWHRLRYLRLRISRGSHLRRHGRLLRLMQRSFAERKKERLVIGEQLPLLWTLARAYEANETGWQESSEITRKLAVEAVDRTSVDRKVGKYLAIVLVTSFFLSIAWLIFGRYFLFSPLFRASGWTDGITGHFLQAVGFAAVFIVIAMFSSFEHAMRHVRIIRLFADYASYAIPFAATIPSIAIYCHWKRLPEAHALQALYDGLFACGFTLGPVLVALAIINVLKLLRRERSIWDDPRTEFLREALECLDKIIPPMVSLEPMQRVVEQLLQKNEKWVRAKPDLVEKLRASIKADAPGKAAEQRWALLRRQVKKQHSPNPVFAALESFLWLFHPSNPSGSDEWGQSNRMLILASHIRNAARCVQIFGDRQRTGEAVQDNWQRRVCEERSAFLRNLQRGPLLPRPDTRDYLVHEFKLLFELVLRNDWGNMPLIELPDVPRLSLWQKSYRFLRTVIVAALPLATLYALSDHLKTIHATISGTLWGGAIIWFAVSLLTLLDERFSEKLSGVKEVLGALKTDKSKE
jgi:hypothetical protein